MREGFDVHGDHRRLKAGVSLKAVIAQLQAVLIFTLCAKTAVALVAGADCFVVCLFLSAYFGMDFDHSQLPPPSLGQAACHAD